MSFLDLALMACDAPTCTSIRTCDAYELRAIMRPWRGPVQPTYMAIDPLPRAQDF